MIGELLQSSRQAWGKMEEAMITRDSQASIILT